MLLTFRDRARALPSRPALADWRRFASPNYRTYHLLALCQGVVMVLAGLDVLIPFALDIGCPPALAVLLGALPVAGGMAQLAVPRLLARTDGNLRGLTLLAAAVETRGLLYALLALAVAAGALGGVAAVLLLAALILLSGILGTVTAANLMAWHSAVLPEDDRRLVMPRLMVISMAVGALLLFPMAILLDGLAARFGLVVYALPFALAGLVGVAELFVVARLPRPGRVIVPAEAMQVDAPETPEERQFLRVTALNALGMGLTPYLSVYAIAVLGLSAGFAMTLGAVGMLTMVVAAAVAGGVLVRGSAAAMLRRSFLIRAAAVALPILAWPGSPAAALLLYMSVMLASVGFAAGQLAANERLFRLIRGPAVIRQHGRYLARTSLAMGAGQLTTGAVLGATGGLGYPVFALLFAASSSARLLAHRAASPQRAASPLRSRERSRMPPALGWLLRARAGTGG